MEEAQTLELDFFVRVFECYFLNVSMKIASKL